MILSTHTTHRFALQHFHFSACTMASSSVTPVSSSSRSFTSLIPASLKYAALFFPALIVSVVSRFRSAVYDKLIVRLTSVWYRNVLQKIPPHSTILDVGIGTGSALIQCCDIVTSKDLRVVGIDYDADYVKEAQSAVHQAGLDSHISVVCMSVHDVEKRQAELASPPGNEEDDDVEQDWLLEEQVPSTQFDAVYFSGSFSLLQDMAGALQTVKRLLKNSSSKIYITQTYQRKTPPLFKLVKPMLRYVTTIDFGKLITEEDAKRLYYESLAQKCGLTVMEHGVMEHSVDNALQAAYLTVLEPTMPK